jgi:hypothetical protein
MRVKQGLAWSVAFATSAAIGFYANASLAAPKIGVASAVNNHVESIDGDSIRALKNGGDIFSNEKIRTGNASTAQLLFIDETVLSVGAKSEVLLDRFIYDPNRGTGNVVIKTGAGAFRFVTGSQPSSNYQIKTQAATMGIRGTIIEWVEKHVGRGQLQAVYSVRHGLMQITLAGNTYTVKAGQMIIWDSVKGTAGPVQNVNGLGDPRLLEAFNGNTNLANLLSSPGASNSSGGGGGGGGGGGVPPPSGGFTPPGQFQLGSGTPGVGPGIGNLPPGITGAIPPGIGGSNTGKGKAK